jgi:SNF2 family DNA or RNA helicase
MKAPYPYQQQAIEFASTRNVLIADECGLGKSLEAVRAVLARRKAANPFWRVLVVCPLRTKPQWVMEIRDADPDTAIYPLEVGLPVALQTQSKKPSGWVLIHYEAVAPLFDELSTVLWDAVICDEAHRLKNRNTIWTKKIKHIPAVRKIALTGTPMEKSPADLWSLGNWLYPDWFTSYWMFFKHYVQFDENIFGAKKITGTRHVKQLTELLAKFMVRRTKAEVAPDLPPRIMQHVPVAMTNWQEKFYAEIENMDDIILRQEGYDPIYISNVLAKIVRLQQVTSWPSLLGRSYPSGKVEWVMDWLADNPEETVVIFTKFRGLAEYLHTAIQEPNDIIVGGVLALPERFLNGDARIIVGTIAAMGEGLNLQRADSAIFIDQEWSTIKMEQAFDRVHRITIDKPKNIYLLHCPDTVDDLVRDALDNKWEVTQLVYEATKYWNPLKF